MKLHGRYVNSTRWSPGADAHAAHDVVDALDLRVLAVDRRLPAGIPGVGDDEQSRARARRRPRRGGPGRRPRRSARSGRRVLPLRQARDRAISVTTLRASAKPGAATRVERGVAATSTTCCAPDDRGARLRRRRCGTGARRARRERASARRTCSDGVAERLHHVARAEQVEQPQARWDRPSAATAGCPAGTGPTASRTRARGSGARAGRSGARRAGRSRAARRGRGSSAARPAGCRRSRRRATGRPRARCGSPACRAASRRRVGSTGCSPCRRAPGRANATSRIAAPASTSGGPRPTHEQRDQRDARSGGQRPLPDGGRVDDRLVRQAACAKPHAVFRPWPTASSAVRPRRTV